MINGHEFGEIGHSKAKAPGEEKGMRCMFRKTAGAVLLALLWCVSAFAEGSWSQINQEVGRDAGWKRFVGDTSAFSLGGAKPYEGDAGLSVRDWGTYPSVDGSTVCVPMAMECARQWLDLPEGDLSGFVNFSTTPYALDRLTHGKPNPMVTILSRGEMMDDTHPVDLYMGTGPNADERAAAEQAGADLVFVPFCYDAFIFMVNAENPVENLSSQQIRDMYSAADPDEEFPIEAKISNWKEVGGEDLPVIAYQRPHGSGSQTAMEEMVMKDVKIAAVESNFITDGMAEAVQRIGSYDNARAAIGYSYLYYVEGLYKSGDIRVLSVDGIAPTPENLRSGAYPYTVCYYAGYRAENENAKRFAEWLTGDEGQKAVAQAGYIALR